MAGNTGPVRLNEARAKQGLRGLHVFWVLAISLGLGFVALAIVWAWHAHELGQVHGAAYAPPQAAPQFESQYPAAKQTGDTPDNSVPPPQHR
jgi:hypothetical protein